MMYWWYFIILCGAVVYFGYRRYIVDKRRKQALAPKCEACGTAMVLQTHVGDNEIWECPKCNPDKQ